jgi:hypothetical protein
MFTRAPKANAELLRLLRGLRADPTLTVPLHESLFSAQLWALIEAPAPIADMSFLSYPSRDGLRELPVFTAEDRALLRQLAAESGALPTEVSGPAFWPKMLDVAKTGECEVAVDPGEAHGIRVTLQMALGMVQMYGSPSATNI